MRLLPLFASLLSAGVLVACGGGGSSTPTDPTPPSTSATVTLTGVVSKGLMANADVKAHPVKADGSVDLGTVLASTTSDASGKYSLSFEGTKGQPYVIRVSAKADGSTTHLDEVTGKAQALPDGFAMRSLLTPATTGTVTTSASITPFSELAVSAAEHATGGITSANASQAVSTVSQLLGFDPSAVTAKPVSSATTSDEKKLAVMLAAVSQLAANGDLGCTAGTDGAKTKCVVDALAASYSTNSIKPGSTTTVDVSKTLSDAVVEVLSNSTVTAGVDATLLTPVLTNLACSGSACTPATGGTTPTPDPVAVAISGAKTLFAEIKSDWSALFSREGVTALATGEANVAAYKISQVADTVQVPVLVMGKDLAALMTGVDLYRDYQSSGGTTPTSRSKLINAPGYGHPQFLAPGDGTVYAAIGCTLYTDTTNTVVATTPAQVGSIGCAANYYVSAVNTATNRVYSYWRHGFTMLPPAADGSYKYSTRDRRRESTCPLPGVAGTCTLTANEDLQPTVTTAWSGTVAPVFDAAGDYKSFTVSGDLPGAFKQGTNTLENHHHHWSLNATRSGAVADGLTPTSKSETVSVTGSIQTYSDATTQSGSLQIKTGTIAVSDVTLTYPDGSTNVGIPSAFGLDVVWTLPTAEFEGAVSASAAKLDKSGLNPIPSSVNVNGAIRSINGGVSTDVLAVNATLAATGYNAYDAAAPASPTNFYTVALTAVGKVSAPGRPVLEFTLGGSKPSNVPDASSVTVQYRRLVNGTATQVISGTSVRDAVTGNWTTTLNEATNKLSMSWTGQPASAKLLYNGSTEIGTIDAATKMLTFTDGSFMSLDVGL